MDDRAFSEIGAAWNAAHWTAVAAFAAWLFGALSLVISSIGMWVIWRQLKATEDSAKAAAEAAQAAALTSRPWVQMTPATLAVKEASADVEIWAIKCGIQNVGATPALHVAVRADLQVGGNYVGRLAEQREQFSAGVTVFPGQKHVDVARFTLPVGCAENQFILLTAQYSDGVSVRQTPQLLLLVMNKNHDDFTLHGLFQILDEHVAPT